MEVNALHSITLSWIKNTMLELQWPWVFLAIPLPYLIYRFMTPASQSGGLLCRYLSIVI